MALIGSSAVNVGFMEYVMENKYFTGKLCKHGHLSYRWKCNGQCIECRKTIYKYAIKNSRRKFYEANKKNLVHKKHEWRKNNWDHVLLKAREYCQKRRATKKNAGGHFTKQDIINLLSAQKGLCGICKCDIKNKYHIDHIRPISRGGNNYIENIQLLCPTCNLSKGSKFDTCHNKGKQNE